MVTAGEIRKIQLFRDVPLETLDAISGLLKLQNYSDGETIFYRGDPGFSMFMILDGSVAISLTNDEGVEYTLATLGDGDVFGEMALLTGEPRSANVTALSNLSVVEVDQDGFEELVKILPDFNTQLLRLLASRLGMSTIQRQAEHLEAKEMLASLISHHHPPDIDHFPGATKWAKQLNETIRKLAASDENVLLLGEKGAGKELAAKLIHFTGHSQSNPFFSLDCANTPPVLRELPGRAADDDLMAEASQEAALFGHEAGSTVYAKGTRRGYLELADGGTLLLENVEYLTPKVQEELADYIRTGTFCRIGEDEPLRSALQIISTATEELEPLVKRGEFHAELLDLLSAQVIKMPPLRERKKDIPILAENFLTHFAQKSRKNITGFTDDAMNALVDYAWPSNMLELRQVVDRAVAICPSDIIRAEHIFLDITPFTSDGKFNLLKIEQIDNVVRNKWYPAGLLLFTVPFFAFLVLYTIFGPQGPNVANMLAWAVLWPVLILSIGLTARSWCGYCPMSAISNTFAFRRKKFLPVPEWLKKHGIWFGIFGFITIIWVEHSTHMVSAPRATGILFLCIVSGAAVTTALLGRRVWCLYLCPLGRMIGQFSTISMLELRGNSNVCLSQCTTHDCIKEKSCPMGLHPSSEKTKHDCILCLTCLKSCKHRSVHIDALLPRAKMLAMGKWEFPRAFFSVLLAGAVMAVKFPSWLGSLKSLQGRVPEFLVSSNILAGLPIYLGIIAACTGAVYAASYSGSKEKWKNTFVHAGYAYLPTAFFGLFNIYFREFVRQGREILPAAAAALHVDGLIPAAWITPNLGTLKALFPLITIAGIVFSLYLLREIKSKYSIPMTNYMLHQAAMIITCLVFLIIL